MGGERLSVRDWRLILSSSLQCPFSSCPVVLAPGPRSGLRGGLGRGRLY